MSLRPRRPPRSPTTTTSDRSCANTASPATIRMKPRAGWCWSSTIALIEGGSSGEVVVEQDLESSRLWSLVSHDEEPFMPPGQDKLPDAKLAVIRQWIEGGLLENSGSTAKAKKPSVQLAAPTATGRPEGPVAMPEGLSREPVVYTPRAAAVSALASSPWAPLVAVAGQQQIALYHSRRRRVARDLAVSRRRAVFAPLQQRRCHAAGRRWSRCECGPGRSVRRENGKPVC